MSARADARSQPALGIIGGSAFLDGFELENAEIREVATTHGNVVLHVAGDFVFLRRHGEQTYRPPHRIPHHAHVLALDSLGVRAVAGFASAGALRADLRPGDIIVPEDYLSWHAPPTFAGDEYLHVVPALDANLRELLVRSARAVAHTGGDAHAVQAGGVYAQMSGPRFETRAEIRLLADYADVVGMTAASEATLCQERGIGYAMICFIDNWAHGVGPPLLTVAAFQAQVARNARLARALLHEVVERWRAETAAGPTREGTP